MSRALLVVLGAGLAMFGAFVLALGGGGLLLAGGGTTSSDPGWVTTPAAALVIPPEAVSTRVADAASDGPVTLRVTVRPRDPSRRIVAGVATTARVARLLAGVDVATVTDVTRSPLRVTSRRTFGTASPGDPDAVSWQARIAVAAAPVTLAWRVVPGSHRIVVMNADGSAGVDVEMRFRVDADDELATVWVVLAIAGGVLLFVGAVIAAAGAVAVLAARNSPSTGG